jgi:NADH dehydrogenase
LLPATTDVVTGSFGYIGRYITAQLLQAGRQVKTITTHVDKPNPFGSNVVAYPYDFNRPERLTETLRGADTLYNTYWIRFNHGGLTFEQALQNTDTLFRCAASAGVRKIVHISVTQASPDSPLPYYAGKGLQEQAVKESGVPYSIVRPTLVFGKEDILVNNIAWLMRKFPVFPIAGDGQYKMQPIYVDDLAKIVIEQASGSHSETIDAIGTETHTFLELAQSISSALGRNVSFARVSPGMSIFLGKVVGLFLRDVILTGDELRGLMDNLLTSPQKPNAPTKFSGWLEENRQTIGRAYSSELDRHFRWSLRK